MLIRPTCLVLREHFFCILSVLTRLVGLISTNTIGYFFRPPFMQSVYTFANPTLMSIDSSMRIFLRFLIVRLGWFVRHLKKQGKLWIEIPFKSEFAEPSYITPSTSFHHIKLPATLKLFQQVAQQSRRRKVHRCLENWRLAGGNTKVFLIVKTLRNNCKELLERKTAHVPKVT